MHKHDYASYTISNNIIHVIASSRACAMRMLGESFGLDRIMGKGVEKTTNNRYEARFKLMGVTNGMA